MSTLVTLLNRRAPKIGNIEFDAVLEDTITATAEATGYTIESGAKAQDHVIIHPFEVQMTVLASNNPLSTKITDFLGGGISNILRGGVVGTIAGLSAGLLSGGGTRSSGLLEALINIMVSRDTVDVFAGDLQLTNMIITGIERTKTPENENGVEILVSLQEYATIGTVSGSIFPGQDILNQNDSSSHSAAAFISKGEKSIADFGGELNAIDLGYIFWG